MQINPETDVGALPVLAPDVDVRRRVIADEDEREAWRTTECRGHLRDARPQFVAEGLSESCSIE
jgi:hypothetical protein